MLNQNNNEMIIKSIIHDKNVYIIIDSNASEKDILRDIKKINFEYIKYQGKKRFKKENIEQNTIEFQECHCVLFDSIPKELVDEICNLIDKKLKQHNYKVSFYECLAYVVSLFRKLIFPRKKDKELRGDICEAIFILKARELFNVDIAKYYRGKDNLFDFYFDKAKKSVEVKGTTKCSGEIKINFRQINETTNRDFFVVEYQFISDGYNILDLYEKIGIDKSEIIKQKYDKWKHYKDAEDDGKKLITERYLINLEHVQIYKYNNDLLPEINIKNYNSIKNVEITLSTQNGKEKEFDAILEYI